MSWLYPFKPDPIHDFPDGSDEPITATDYRSERLPAPGPVRSRTWYPPVSGDSSVQVHRWPWADCSIGRRYRDCHQQGHENGPPEYLQGLFHLVALEQFCSNTVIERSAQVVPDETAVRSAPVSRRDRLVRYNVSPDVRVDCGAGAALRPVPGRIAIVGQVVLTRTKNCGAPDTAALGNCDQTARREGSRCCLEGEVSPRPSG